MFFHNHVSGNNFRTFLTGFNLLGDGGFGFLFFFNTTKYQFGTNSEEVEAAVA
jgi:hypothetical protein